MRTPQQTLVEAADQLRAVRPFHAHEVFEDAWKAGPDGERGLWQPLAQLMVALTHAARGNPTGAARLRQRSLAALADHPDRCPHGLDLAALEDAVAGVPAAELGTVAVLHRVAELLHAQQ